MKKIIATMIPFLLGIIWLGIEEYSFSESKLSKLTIENIEALTEGTELPEVTITCNSGYDGLCFIQGTRMAMCGEYMYYPCEYIGLTAFSCYNPCKGGRLIR